MRSAAAAAAGMGLIGRLSDPNGRESLFFAHQTRPDMTILSLTLRAGIFVVVHVGVLAGIVMLF